MEPPPLPPAHLDPGDATAAFWALESRGVSPQRAAELYIPLHLALAEYSPAHQLRAWELVNALDPGSPERARWEPCVSSVVGAFRNPGVLRVLAAAGVPVPPPYEGGSRPRASSVAEMVRELPSEARLLRVWAEPDPADPYRRPVALVHYRGRALVAKEVADESEGPLGIADNEREILRHLDGAGGASPRVLLEFGGKFILREPVFGLTLDRVGWGGGSPDSRLRFLLRAARVLASLHAAGVMVGDITDENVTVGGQFFDFSHARRVAPGVEVPAFPPSGGYAAPETLFRRAAGHPADVYSLGMVFYRWVFNSMPVPGLPVPTSRPQGLVASALAAGRPVCSLPGADPRWGSLLVSMVDPDPGRRPSAAAVAAALENFESPDWAGAEGAGGERASEAREPPSRVLLPMRAAVPHRGHVNLIARCLDLGFEVTVALAQSFTATRDLNPIPKWQVARYLRAALREAGYCATAPALTFIYIPYAPLAQHRLLYAMSPGWERTVAVVSGNPEVAELLGPVLEQRPLISAEALCGSLEDYNGTRLRTAIISGDDETVRRLAPPVVYRRLREVLSEWVRPGEEIPYVPAQRVEVQFALAGVDLGGVLKPYEGPEEAILRRLQQRHPRNHFAARDWADPQGVVIEGRNVCPFRLRFTGQRIDLATGSLGTQFEPEFLVR